MIKSPEYLPDDVATLRVALIETRAKLSGTEALIAHLQPVIEKMKRETFGRALSVATAPRSDGIAA